MSKTSKKLTYISMFSGIEAASVAWEPIGFEPVAFAEVDPFPSAVLKKHYPHIPNLGDITNVNWSEYHGKVDIVVGGPPCQAFSVAGLRKALDDPRGVLILEYLRACDQIRPEWIILENVPGLLSADGGRAFGSLLGALEELGYHAAWRVLDAQFFGVAQRRRRIFVVAHARDWRRAAAVLFEQPSVHGHLKSSKEARAYFASPAQGGVGATSPEDRIKEAIAFSYGNSADSRSMGEAEGVTPTIRSAGGGNSVPVVCEPKASGLYSIAGNIIGRGPKSGGNGNGFQDGSDPMYTLTAMDRHAVCQPGSGGGEESCLNPWATQSDRVFPENSVFPSLVGGGRGNRGYAGGCILEGSGEGEAPAIVLDDQGGSRMNVSQEVAPTLRANSKGNEPIVMGSGQANAEVLEGLCPTQCARQYKDPPILVEEGTSALAFDTTQVTSARNRSNPQWNDPCHTLSSCGDAPSACVESYAEGSFSQFREGEVGTLRASGGCLGGGSETLIAEFAPESRVDDVRGFAQNTRNELRYESGDGSVAGALAAQPGMKQQTYLESSSGIRRLTPVECERLQGFPDNWTRIAWNGKPEEQCPNGRRYKAIGNSMAVPVMRWIGEGMALVDQKQSGRE